jgi:hypothetical protein
MHVGCNLAHMGLAHRVLLLAIVGAVAAASQSLTPTQLAELARATNNPFDLAKFIDTHPASDWGVEMKARRLVLAPYYWGQGPFEPCETELLNLKSPEQVIVVIKGRATRFLRYTRQADRSWRAEGTAGTGPREPQDYKLDQTSGTPFLRVMSELDHGSNVHAEGERWYDLTSPGLEPAFSLMPEVWDDRWNIGIGRKVTTSVVERSGEVRAVVHFEFYTQDVAILSWSPTFVYSRAQRGGSFRCRSLDPIVTCMDLNKLTATGEGETPTEEYLIRFAFPGLKKIAAGPDGETKQWLRDYIAARKDTPEVRQIRALLQ